VGTRPMSGSQLAHPLKAVAVGELPPAALPGLRALVWQTRRADLSRRVPNSAVSWIWVPKNGPPAAAPGSPSAYSLFAWYGLSG